MIKLLYIDLFCGAGGTSTGVENARYADERCAKVIACVNHDANRQPCGQPPGCAAFHGGHQNFGTVSFSGTCGTDEEDLSGCTDCIMGQP